VLFVVISCVIREFLVRFSSVFFVPSSPALCRPLFLRAPLASVEGAEGAAEVEEEPTVLWARALAELAAALRALVAHARAVGLGGEEVEEAERALFAPVGDSELARLRALRFREGAAREQAGLLRAAGQTSALVVEWAADDMDVDAERHVRPRLA
jgi:hypothetical protein